MLSTFFVQNIGIFTLKSPKIKELSPVHMWQYSTNIQLSCKQIMLSKFGILNKTCLLKTWRPLFCLLFRYMYIVFRGKIEIPEFVLLLLYAFKIFFSIYSEFLHY